MTGGEKNLSNLFSNTLKCDQWFQVPLTRHSKWAGIAESRWWEAPEARLLHRHLREMRKKCIQNYSHYIHYSQVSSDCLRGVKTAACEKCLSVHQAPCDFQTRSKKRLCLYIILTCQVLFGDLKRHCKDLNKSYYILL